MCSSCCGLCLLASAETCAHMLYFSKGVLSSRVRSKDSGLTFTVLLSSKTAAWINKPFTPFDTVYEGFLRRLSFLIFNTWGEKILQVCLRQNLGVFFYKTQMDGFLFFYFYLVYLTCITFSFALIFRIWIVSSKKTCTARTLSPLLDIVFLNSRHVQMIMHHTCCLNNYL